MFHLLHKQKAICSSQADIVAVTDQQPQDRGEGMVTFLQYKATLEHNVPNAFWQHLKHLEVFPKTAESVCPRAF